MHGEEATIRRAAVSFVIVIILRGSVLLYKLLRLVRLKSGKRDLCFGLHEVPGQGYQVLGAKTSSDFEGEIMLKNRFPLEWVGIGVQITCAVLMYST